MKSAYELAMERLEKATPSKALTDNQKQKLAEVDAKYQAKLAEKEVFLHEQLEKTQDPVEREQIEHQLVSEKARLAEEREAEKDKVRNAE